MKDRKKDEAPDKAAKQKAEAKVEEQKGETVTVEKEKLEEASRLYDEAERKRQEAEGKRDEYLALAQRVQAEFDNYRKRNASVRADAQDEAVRSALLALLPTLDNLTRALNAAGEEQSPLKSGVELTLRGLNEAFGKLGLEGISCQAGDPFDPEKHHAVLTGEADAQHPEDTVMEVLQTGFMARGKVIRYVMVKVAK